jgi:hypothetical protein
LHIMSSSTCFLALMSKCFLCDVPTHH